MDRDDHDGGDQHCRQSARPEHGEQRKHEGGRPDDRFEEEVISRGPGAEFAADAVDEVIEQAAPERGERVAERRPIEHCSCRDGDERAGEHRGQLYSPLAPERPEHDDRDGRRELDAQQADQPEQQARGEQSPPRGPRITRVEQPAADDQDMRGDHLGQRAAAEIDKLRRDRDDNAAGECGNRPIPAARPQKAAQHGGARQQREGGGDQRQVVGRSVADQARQLHQPGDRPRQYPGAHAELKFPGHDAVPEDEAVGRLGRLEDLVVPIEARQKQHRHQPQPDGEQHDAEQCGEEPRPLFRQKREVAVGGRLRFREPGRPILCGDGQARLMRNVLSEARGQGVQPRGT